MKFGGGIDDKMSLSGAGEE